ncbi:MAG: CmpA/NrtA family ABC transporter substrate-binding protein [Pseudomonadales bacterium]|nr:CmpA/NrtA family ABC transporter substrate-binding protein [Pseudomonadales bacterium]
MVHRSQTALEKNSLTIGYMPLSDSLPLLAAEQQGFFEQQGLNVVLQQEVSWANIRDKVLVGHLDAAQMLAPMLLATHMGIGGLRKSMLTPFSMGMNGNAFTISTHLAEQLSDASGHAVAGDAASALKALRGVITDRKHRRQAPLIFAIVFPFSLHNLLLRDWLASTEINPDLDIQLVVLPPSQMVDHLKLQHIDGFFAGAPWNTVAIEQGVGECLVAGLDLWNSAPDKVLGVTQIWADTYPNTLKALVRALYDGCQWADNNRVAGADLLAKHIHLPRELVLPALLGQFVYRLNEAPLPVNDMLVFNRYMANYPWAEHAQWFLGQMQRWNWIDPAQNIDDMISTCYRSDLYRAALTEHPLPAMGARLSLLENEPWQLPGITGDIAMAPTAFSYLNGT